MCSSAEIRKELAAKRLPTDPQIFTSMRDLGVDCALGRCRRVKMQKARFGKGAARAKKLAKLKIPQPRVNLRLFRGGISSAMLWGQQGQGVPPTRTAFLRAKLSRQMKAQAGQHRCCL